ncbi:unnamed protein product [Ilex paraguariensis]|uniref:C2H2-type domain-containing protein n=1 Tax=Ilex paraguariensis TaxID=185542 RepID=A0ABC8SSC2_9AQUA
MVGNAWHLRYRNMHRHKDMRGRPNRPAQFSCRLCNQVFVGAHALVTHYESHLIQDEIHSTRQNDIIINPPQITFQSQNGPQEIWVSRQNGRLPLQHVARNPTLGGATQEIVATPPPRLPAFPPVGLRFGRLGLANPPPQWQTVIGENHRFRLQPPRLSSPPLVVAPVTRNHALGPHPVPSFRQADRTVMTEPSSECTKPFINLLDKPIKEVFEIVDSDDESLSSKSDSKKLDLSLKL